MRRLLIVAVIAVVGLLVQGVAVTSHVGGDADAATLSCSHSTGPNGNYGSLHEIPSWGNFRAAHKVAYWGATPPYVQAKKWALVYTKGPGIDFTWDYSHKTTVYCGF